MPERWRIVALPLLELDQIPLIVDGERRARVVETSVLLVIPDESPECLEPLRRRNEAVAVAEKKIHQGTEVVPPARMDDSHGRSKWTVSSNCRSLTIPHENASTVRAASTMSRIGLRSFFSGRRPQCLEHLENDPQPVRIRPRVEHRHEAGLDVHEARQLG